MRKYIMCAIALCSICGIQAQELNPLAIARKIDAQEKFSSLWMQSKQIMRTPGGSERTLEVESYAMDSNESQLMVYTGPARVKGDKILMLNDGDDIWFFTPKTGRVRHLASHAKRQRVQGSEFSYEDMAGGDIEEKYTVTALPDSMIDGSPCYGLKLVPKPNGPSYSKLHLYADKKQLYMRRILYFEKQAAIKLLSFKDYRQADDHHYAREMRMVNLQTAAETLFETTAARFNHPLSKNMFTTSQLKRR